MTAEGRSDLDLKEVLEKEAKRAAANEARKADPAKKKVPGGGHYIDAQVAVKKHLSGQWTADRVLQREAELRVLAVPLIKSKSRKVAAKGRKKIDNADLIARYLRAAASEIDDRLAGWSRSWKGGYQDRLRLPQHGVLGVNVRVSRDAEFLLQGLTGTAILFLKTEAPVSSDVGDTAGTLLLEYLRRACKSEPEAEACLLIDVFNSRVFQAPSVDERRGCLARLEFQARRFARLEAQLKGLA